jgi:hypothetical protein
MYVRGLDETARKGSLQPSCVDVGTYIPDRLENQAAAFKGPFMCDFATIGRDATCDTDDRCLTASL